MRGSPFLDLARPFPSSALPGPLASLILNVRPCKLNPLPGFWPRVSARCMSFSSANRTKPYPREIPVDGSYMILADFVEANNGVNRVYLKRHSEFWKRKRGTKS